MENVIDLKGNTLQVIAAGDLQTVLNALADRIDVVEGT